MAAKKTRAKETYWEPDLSNPDAAYSAGIDAAMDRVVAMLESGARHYGVMRSLEATRISDALQEYADRIRKGDYRLTGKTPAKAPSAKRKKAVRK